jgi:hypothetical protein
MVWLKYLTTVNQVSSKDEPKVKRFLEDGYQAIMDRRNEDGSFRYAGKALIESVWLTALVVKCLGQVENLIAVNETVIKEAFEFLKDKQNDSGSFVDDGKNITAFVVISFLENSKNVASYKDVIDKALSYIDLNVNNMKSNYDIAIALYALSLGNHRSKSSLLSSLVYEEKKIGDEIFWEIETSNEEKKSLSSDIKEKVKIASYALLAYLKNGNEFETKALAIMMWITAQDQRYFQDLSVVAQALSEISKVFFSSTMNMNLNVANLEFHIDNSNALKPLKFDLAPNTRSITIRADGTGFALLEISYQYETVIEQIKDAFVLAIEVKLADDKKRLGLTIAVNIKDDDENEENIEEKMGSKMEIEFPLGYVYDSESTERLISDGVKVSFNQTFFSYF